jgi:hypothetical protein
LMLTTGRSWSTLHVYVNKSKHPNPSSVMAEPISPRISNPNRVRKSAIQLSKPV